VYSYPGKRKIRKKGKRLAQKLDSRRATGSADGRAVVNLARLRTADLVRALAP